MSDYPKKKGFRLTKEAENLYNEWKDTTGGCCYCSTSPMPPCSSCIHMGNPLNLEECDAYWIKEEVICEMSRESVSKFEVKSPEEESVMRREVTIRLFDDTKGLDVEDSLVGKWSVITEDNDESTIYQLCVDKDVKSAIEKHNKKRSEIVNQEILEKTGAKVFLQPVKLKNLRWDIS